MSTSKPFHVAIIGGGLCGITLAIALRERSIPFTIYESRSSFTEIGAGINVSPNGMAALREIHPKLRDSIYNLATRNPSPYEETWMYFKYGAEINGHEDGDLVFEVKAPPTGTMTMHRQELLAALAGEMGMENARFEKKLSSYTQNSSSVTINFADGTSEEASILVGCDGIHSAVRSHMFPDSPVSKAHFNHDGAYRAVIPIEKAIEAIGESAKYTCNHFGPNGYFIMYPVNNGTSVNCGAWIRKKEKWDRSEWVVQDQGKEFREDLKDWGPRIQKVAELFDESPAFWAAHQHTQQPSTFHDGRVILIGDGAHAMPPHQGAGASQAIEDAYVLAEVLAELNEGEKSENAVEAGMKAFEEVRIPRSSRAHYNSSFSGPLWYDFYEKGYQGQELEEFVRGIQERLHWIWDSDIKGDAEKARRRVGELLSQGQAKNDMPSSQL